MSYRTRAVPVGLGLVAVALCWWGLANGGTHYYYSAAVRSMSDDWFAFATGALDPGPFITVDKLPGAMWVQALSARLFGFSEPALLVPGLLAAAATVLLVFAAVRRASGLLAGAIAGVALAVTPVLFATARVNLPDIYLVCLLAAAAYTWQRALEDGRWRWPLAAGVTIGLAFQVKMLAAFVVVPAFLLAYAIGAPGSSRARLARLSGFLGTAVAVSLSWMATVSVFGTPGRPHVDGGDSVWDMVFGYNGLSRGLPGESARIELPYGGAPGLGRLLNDQLAGQIGWLLPLAALGLLVGWRDRGHRAAYCLWAGWFVSVAIALSAARGIHPYYAVLLAPAIAALAGLGVATAWRARDRWTLPAVIVMTGVLALFVLSRTPDVMPWLRIAVGIAAVIAIAAAIAGPRALAVLAAAGATTTLLAPVVWLLSTPDADGDLMATTNPVAGPPITEVRFGDRDPRDIVAMMFGMPPGSVRTMPDPLPSPVTEPTLLEYLTARRGGRTYLFAAGDASTAAPYLAAGHPVLPMGGFTARDPAPTISELADLVRDRTLRYVLHAPAAGGPSPYAARAAWLSTNCATVAPPDYVRGHRGMTLYDCDRRP
ncbi:4-amino-4-deoxy-L-arabinose transferase-like glycosyltransferase [Herbihabitans rhizosphaerae]|uniref:4-amino-4-deoxy-L-arabinose transferase-like glycosyltransferase n=1 Tax=Herbihabitans rhizosphaerae TaxID=1872711 RepID=A0A4Q7L5W4_9PSEU|nr:glycosyltransferase family 39 protein [Herbihabitans rhizosphaerae]RZS44220.1 4-amino-4-deoxy-L-arabinose transferase-like glycosyltransferase [Herbihabitans rhizosphaerae]